MQHLLFFKVLASVPNSSFPQATNQTLLDKFKRQHEGNSYIEFSAVMEPAFIIRHYAGKVKYGVKVSRSSHRVLRAIVLCLVEDVYIQIKGHVVIFMSLSLQRRILGRRTRITCDQTS